MEELLNRLDPFADYLPLVPVVVFAAIFAAVLIPLARRRRRRRELLQHGEIGMARVVAIAQTGTTVNRVPEMRIVLDLEQSGAEPRRVTLKQIVDIGAMPRAGDRVYVLLDPKNPDRVILSPSPSGVGLKSSDGAGGTVDLGSDVTRDIAAMTPALRERHEFAIATVVSVAPTAISAFEIALDIDTIGAPKRRLTIRQIVSGPPPAAGERVYLLVDPENPDSVALVPPSMTGGQKLSTAGANRLDPLVLGPQILTKGAKAAGIVLSAAAETLASAAAAQLAAQGANKWRLALAVTPEDGSPAYQATLTITLTTAEKAARIAHAGAQVPLRYDPADPQTLAIDSIAMGYGNPYDSIRKLVQSA